MAESVDTPARIGVLFVCHANICRSPLAEGIFRFLARARGIEAGFDIDSAGTWAPEGMSPHEYSLDVAATHGIGPELLSRASRGVTPEDMERFAHVIAMDRRNLADLERLRRLSGFGTVEGQWPRVRLMRHVLDPKLEGLDSDVDDPVRGGPADFETTYALLHAACERLLDELAPV
jgi:protein-tyrosine phosphatase